jgi:hypothetical protein
MCLREFQTVDLGLTNRILMVAILPQNPYPSRASD